MKNDVRVRIAPSPTGYLHIGTARTALFNFLFAKKNNGKFLLRIEDTDLARNNQASYDSIINGLKWLGLNWEGEVVYQSKRMQEHAKIAEKLIANGFAYYCFLPASEIAKRKEVSEKSGIKYIHKHSKEDETPNSEVKPVVRIKVPRNTEILNDDLVQGKVVINSETIEDFVILRNDGSPVYMLSVVCDDIEMQITHIIRGDDHLTNTPKQILIYNGLGIKPPLFAHIPLIHGMDGAKLSKRHGALAIEEYRNMGYLPEALRSYLVRLGWGSENDEILNDESLISAFSIEGIGRSPSKFDFEKLKNINHHFIQTLPESYILEKVLEGEDFQNIEAIKRAISKIRYRYSKITDIQKDFKAFENDYIIYEDAEQKITEGRAMLESLIDFFKTNSINFSTYENLEEKFKTFLKEKSIPFGKAGPLLRACLIGTTSSIGIFEIIYILGLPETLKRLSEI